MRFGETFWTGGIANLISVIELDLEQLDTKLFKASGIGDFDQYKQTFHPDKSPGLFVHELVGLERGSAREAFADCLDESKFNT